MDKDVLVISVGRSGEAALSITKIIPVEYSPIINFI